MKVPIKCLVYNKLPNIYIEWRNVNFLMILEYKVEHVIPFIKHLLYAWYCNRNWGYKDKNDSHCP